MPDILVEVKGTWLHGQQTAFLEAVHGAVVEALKTPDDEPLARLIEHPATHYLTPHASGSRFTRIEIVLFAGRSLDAKRALYQAMVRALHPFDVPPLDIKVVLVEVTPADVGFRGGVAACDIDIGYALQI